MFSLRFDRLALLLKVTRSGKLVRRYFVLNGFDGALTLLGMNVGFRLQGGVELPVALSACLGAAVALAMSGLTSAYLSESAERLRELKELESAMVQDLGESLVGEAMRVTAWVIALTNGLAPLALALLTMSPLWLAHAGVPLPVDPHTAAVAVGFAAIFVLGVFLGNVAGQNWLWTGVRAALVAAVTVVVVTLVGG